ncbi:MAG TPA: hypothetical protein DHW14_01275 [Clostridiales bacterium]|nr:hypothetical protein [Clostridiales bacterium]
MPPGRGPAAPESVGSAVREAAGVLRRAGCDTPLLDAEVLLCHVTGLSRETLLAHPERRLTPLERRAYREVVGRRAARCPLAYITGRREFMSFDLEVGPGVLVPRPETELLVEVAAAAAREAGARLVADVGTGSGAVVVALARLLPECRFVASDSSPRALEYAARNIARHGLQDRVKLYQGDLLEAFAPAASGRPSGPASSRPSGPASGRRLLDGVVANLPYVAQTEWPGLPPEVRLYEPPESLLGGLDGLDLFRRLASQLPFHLAPGGFVCLEVGAEQADAVTALLMGTGLFDSVRVHRDLAGRPRVLAARRAPAGPAAGPGRDSPLGVGQQLGRDRRREGPAERSSRVGPSSTSGPVLLPEGTMSRKDPDDRREGGGARARVIRVSPQAPEPRLLQEAASCLRRGGLVAFPTETVYGLGADARQGRAVRAVFEAKGRPPDNPLIVHVSSPAEVRPLVRRLPERAEALMRAFWPGPLSLVLERSGAVASEVSCGLDTVAVRMPDHPVALELIRLAGVPVAAPSANRSGYPSPTRAEDVLADLGDRIDYVIDAGPCSVGVESTVLDLTEPVPTVLRPGGITLEELRRVLGDVRLAAGADAGADLDRPPKSPGLRHRHYAPRARVILVLPETDRPGEVRAAEAVARAVEAETGSGRRVGVACTAETAARLRARLPASVLVRPWGRRTSPPEVASNLFAVLRDLDREEVEVIVAEGMPESGLGLAINDRLRRAAAAGPEVEPARGRRSDPEGGPPGDTILLVCTGNTCRSPMGAVILAEHLRRAGLSGLRVESAGTAAVEGAPASREAVEVMKERGLDLSGHRSRPLTKDLVSQARLILTMEKRHRDAVLEAHPEAADRVHTLKGFAGTAEEEGGEDVADPIGQGPEAYRRAAEEIARAAAGVADRLARKSDFEELLQAGEDEQER